VVSWHAPWSEACSEAASALSAAATAHPGAAFFSLDVEASPANTALALEKVMRKPESRRVGAKPALRSGERFPCITLHYLPSLQPWATLAGPAAVQQLHHALAEHTGFKPGQQTAPPSTAAAPGSGGSGGRSSSAEPSRLVVLKRGALQAKEVLAEGRAAGAPVIMVWTHSGEGETAATAALRSAAAHSAGACAGLLLVDADAAACKANELLAGALKVGSYPEVHVYRDMKLASKLSGPSASPSELLRLAQQLAHSGAPASPAAPMLHAAAPGSPAVAASQAPPVEQLPVGSPPDVFDPPAGKFAKPGAAKRFPDGRFGYFFPKMPCLRWGLGALHLQAKRVNSPRERALRSNKRRPFEPSCCVAHLDPLPASHPPPLQVWLPLVEQRGMGC
jgi:hypothetical protein